MTTKEIAEITRGLRLLYVEDEIDIRSESSRFFEKFFKTVDVAGNGKEGLELFQKGHYDVVISDLKMPVMGGERLLAEVAKIAPETITVAMCGLSGPTDNEALVCDYRLSKPPQHQALIDLMASIARTTKGN